MRPSLPGLASDNHRRRSSTSSLLWTTIGVVLAVLVAFVIFQPLQTQKMLLLNSYKVEIVPGQAGIYEVWIPVPVDIDSKVAPGFEDEVAVADGNATIALISTDHGPALKVAGNGIVRISWVTDWKETEPTEGIDFLSMTDPRYAPRMVWSYCNQDELEVKIFLFSGHWYPESRSGNREIRTAVDGELNNMGWQVIFLY